MRVGVLLASFVNLPRNVGTIKGSFMIDVLVLKCVLLLYVNDEVDDVNYSSAISVKKYFH